MFIDKLIATAPGLVGIVVIGFIGHVPLLCIAAVDGVGGGLKARKYGAVFEKNNTHSM